MNREKIVPGSFRSSKAEVLGIYLEHPELEQLDLALYEDPYNNIILMITKLKT